MPCGLPNVAADRNCSGATRAEFSFTMGFLRKAFGVNYVFGDWDRDEIHIETRDRGVFTIYSYRDIMSQWDGAGLRSRLDGNGYEHMSDMGRRGVRKGYGAIELFGMDPMSEWVLSRDVIERMRQSFRSSRLLETPRIVVEVPNVKPFKKPSMKIKKSNKFTMNAVEIKKILTDYLKDKKLLDRAGVLEERVTINIKGGTLNSPQTTITIEVSQEVSEDLKTPAPKVTCPDQMQTYRNGFGLCTAD